MSKIGHLTVILDGPRELDGPLLPRLKGGGEQLLGGAVASVFVSRLESTWELATALTARVFIVWP